MSLKRRFFQLKEDLTSVKKMHFSGQGSAARSHLVQAAGKDVAQEFLVQVSAVCWTHKVSWFSL